MNVLDTCAAFVVEHGLALLVGTTIVLGAFSLGLLLSRRSLPNQHRLAGTAMFAVAVYVAAAAVPLPRWALPVAVSTSQTATTSAAEAPRQPPTPARTPTGRPSNEPFSLAPSSPPAKPIDATSTDGTPTKVPAAAGNLDPRLVLAVDHSARPSRPLAGGMQPIDDTPDQASPPIWPRLLVAALALGFVGFAAQLLLGWWHLRRILARATEAPAAVRALVQLPKRARIRVAATRVQPFCVGVLRPTIVLPAHLADADLDVATPERAERTRFVLRHERAHLLANDPAMRLVAALLRPLLFWHPLYWWLQRKLRFTGELLADDAAARGSVAQYVRCMMTLSTHPDPVAGDMLATTIFRRRSELFRRLEMMLQRDETISRTPSRAGRLVRAATTTLLVGLCAGAFGVERAAAQDPVKRDARREVRALKKELARLRAEIVTLQAQANRAASGVTDTADAPSGFGGFPTVEVGGGSGGAIRSNGRRATTYTVQAGDTLAQIARRCYGDTSKVDRIMRSNPDLDPRRLKVGQRITIHGAQPRVTGMQGSTGAGLAAPRAPRASGVAGVAVTAPSPTAEPTQPGLATAPQPEVDPVQAPPPPPPTGAFGSRPARSPAPGAGLVTGGGRRTAPAPATAGMTAANPSPAPQPRRAPASRSLSGLAELVTRCIELKGDVDIAKVKVEGADSEPDRKIAIIRLRTKERQYEAVRSMLHGELESAEMELEHTAKLHEKGFVSQRELRAAERRIALLRQALK